YHCDHSPHIRPFFILMTPPPPRSTLFPYTTLFRSIVGTPGRLADHLRRGNIQSNTINTLVLDEYDKSVEWGFQEEIEEIVSKIEYINFVFLASATKAEEIPSFIPIKSLETLDFRVEKEESDKIIQILVETEKKDKLEELVKLLSALGERRSIVFCNHK